MKDFHDLRVWERSHRLTLEIYSATLKFPREELYGLTSQIRRCAVSIGANIAEGCGKMGNNEFQRFSRLRPARQVNWTTNYCLPRTWAISPNPTTQESPMNYHRPGRC
jgi:hypothetical protein